MFIAGTVYYIIYSSGITNNAGNFSNTASRNWCIKSSACTSCSISVTIPTPTNNDGYNVIFDSNGSASGTVSTSCDVAMLRVGNNLITPPVTAGCAITDVACCSYTIPSSLCNVGQRFFKAIVRPIDPSCSQVNATTASVNYTVTCPSAILTGTQAVCGTSANLTVTFTNVVGTPNVTINYTKDGVPLVYGPVPYTNPLSIPVTMSGDYIITGVTFASGNCMASVSGMATVTLTPIPTAAITASTNISGCLPATSDDGTVTVSFGPAGSTGPWVITYSVNGVVYEATTTSNPFTFTTDIPGTYTLLNVEHESSGCSAPGGTQLMVEPPATQQYYFTYTLSNGCEVIGSISVTVQLCSVACTTPVVSTSNACIGGGNVTFTQTGGDTGGSWSVSGGGTIDPASGVFTPSTPGCFVATYTTPTGGCTDSENFVVFPSLSDITVSNTCNAALTLPTVPARPDLTKSGE
ncbi:MAG: hypothetical protein IPN89_11475 [Saprospiraceae bacterium]|nr:hypothetical protein [Saprospiraceae bacterium]